jgi:hypothetical protein
LSLETFISIWISDNEELTKYEDNARRKEKLTGYVERPELNDLGEASI